VLTESELATATLTFHLSDYDELDRYKHDSQRIWETYDPADRQMVTSQHGLQRRWFIRRGAQPSWHQQIENARQRLTEAEESAESAARAVTWAREALARIETQALEATS
jgi:hypothetical protein